MDEQSPFAFDSGSVSNGPPLVKGRYEILRKIGQGGFAATYLALDKERGTHCVVKELAWKTIEDWKTIELFEREARVLESLDHDRIPSFIEFFKDDAGAETKIYLVQEYIPGTNLAESIAGGRRYTEKQVIRIAIQVCDILLYLHSFSPPIIHRDIKPSNILINEKGEVHLIDFGAVRDKVLHAQKTQPGEFTVIGTYGYMPFEQFQGRALPASDIYSLGVSLISVLSHKEPHEMDSLGSRIEFESHLTVSPELEHVLRRMTQPHLEHRYGNVAELKADLQAILDGTFRIQEPVKQQKVNRRTIAALVCSVLILLGGLYMVQLAKNPTPSLAPVATPVVDAVPTRPARPPVVQAVPTTPIVARGLITYDGKPVTAETNFPPTFWFRNETTGKIASAETTYKDGEFTIHGLPPGDYGVSINFDANQNNAHSYPGDLRSWTQFTVNEGAIMYVPVTVQKIIHMTLPQDNGRLIEGWEAECEGKKALSGPVNFQWAPMGNGVFYDYKIIRVDCPYTYRNPVASGTTQETILKVDIPESGKGEYYLLELYARKEGVRIGMLMTHGSNGYGWDYRFRVK